MYTTTKPFVFVIIYTKFESSSLDQYCINVLAVVRLVCGLRAGATVTTHITHNKHSLAITIPARQIEGYETRPRVCAVSSLDRFFPSLYYTLSHNTNSIDVRPRWILETWRRVRRRRPYTNRRHNNNNKNVGVGSVGSSGRHVQRPELLSNIRLALDLLQLGRLEALAARRLLFQLLDRL